MVLIPQAPTARPSSAGGSSQSGSIASEASLDSMEGLTEDERNTVREEREKVKQEELRKEVDEYVARKQAEEEEAARVAAEAARVAARVAAIRAETFAAEAAMKAAPPAFDDAVAAYERALALGTATEAEALVIETSRAGVLEAKRLAALQVEIDVAEAACDEKDYAAAIAAYERGLALGIATEAEAASLEEAKADAIEQARLQAEEEERICAEESDAARAEREAAEAELQRQAEEAEARLKAEREAEIQRQAEEAAAAGATAAAAAEVAASEAAAKEAEVSETMRQLELAGAGKAGVAAQASYAGDEEAKPPTPPPEVEQIGLGSARREKAPTGPGGAKVAPRRLQPESSEEEVAAEQYTPRAKLKMDSDKVDRAVVRQLTGSDRIEYIKQKAEEAAEAKRKHLLDHAELKQRKFDASKKLQAAKREKKKAHAQVLLADRVAAREEYENEQRQWKAQMIRRLQEEDDEIKLKRMVKAAIVVEMRREKHYDVLRSPSAVKGSYLDRELKMAHGSPGPGTYSLKSTIALPTPGKGFGGGKASKTALEQTIMRAREMPGPGTYSVIMPKDRRGGNMTKGKTKSELERIIHSAQGMPGPQYLPRSDNRGRSWGKGAGAPPFATAERGDDPMAREQSQLPGPKYDVRVRMGTGGIRMSKSAPKSALDVEIASKRGMPGPGAYSYQLPPRAGGVRFGQGKTKSSLEALIDRARDQPGPGEYAYSPSSRRAKEMEMAATVKARAMRKNAKAVELRKAYNRKMRMKDLQEQGEKEMARSARRTERLLMKAGDSSAGAVLAQFGVPLADHSTA